MVVGGAGLGPIHVVLISLDQLNVRSKTRYPLGWWVKQVECGTPGSNFLFVFLFFVFFLLFFPPLSRLSCAYSLPFCFVDITHTTASGG